MTTSHRRALAVTLAMCMVYFFSYFQRVAVPGTIFNELQSDFLLSAGGVSLLGAIYLYLYGLMQIPTGLLADRFGGPKVLIAGAVLLTIGSAWFPLAHSPLALYASRGIIGVGASLIYVSIIKEVNELFAPRHFAMVLSVVLLLGYSGGLAGTLPFEEVSRAWGWRASLLAVAALCALSLLVLLLVLQRTHRARRGHVAPVSLVPPLKRILANHAGYPALIAFPLQFSLYFVVQGSIGKKMLEDVTGIPSSTSATITFLMMLVAIVCTSGSGFLSRLAGNRRKPFAVLGASLALVSVLGLALGAGFGPSPLVLGGFSIGLALSTVGSTMYLTSFKELNAGEAAGAAVGVLNCANYLAVALVSNGAGWVLDRFAGSAVRTDGFLVYPRPAYTALFAICLALAALGFTATLLMRETGGEAAAAPATAVREPR